MADETGVPPDNGRNIEVTRMSVGTAEVKDMHVDLLEAVNASIGSQTERIEQLSKEELKQVKENAEGIEGAIHKLRGINEELIAVMRSQTGGGEEGGSGGGGGIAASELKTHQRSLGIINKAAEGQLTLNDAKEEFVELLKAEKKVMAASFIEGLIEGGRSLISFRTAMDETRKRFQKTMEASRSGIADIPDMFLDDFRKVFMFGMGEAGDSLVGTFELIQDSLQQNLASPMVLVGGNINEVAREMASFRSDMEDAGLDLYRNLGAGAQSEVFVRLFDAQKRGDRMADIRDVGVRHQMGEQIAALRLISENTGLSLDELIKSNGTSLQTLASLEAAGMITAEQKKNLTALMVDMGTNAPEFEDLLAKVIRSGGSKAAFEAGNADIAEAMRKIGISDYYETLNSLKDMDPVTAREQGLVFGQRVSDALKAYGEERGGPAVLTLGDAMFDKLTSISTGINAMRELDADRGKQSGVMRLYNKFDDFMKNKWPIAGLVSAISVQTIIAIAHGKMLMSNTAALYANSASRGFGGGKGKGGKGSFSKIGAFAGKALKATGAIAGISMAGKDLYDAAQGDTSNENTGALIGTAIGGLLGTLIPIPGVGTMMGMAIGNFAGEAIGGLIPSSSPKGGVGATPSAAGITSPNVAQVAGSGSNMGQNAFVTNMMVQTRILESIAGSMHTNNSLQREIRDRIGFGASNSTGPRDSTKKPTDIAIVPGRLGS